GIDQKFLGADNGKPITVTFDECPLERWCSSHSGQSYPKYIADTLNALGDTNAKYLGKTGDGTRGNIQVTSGPRKILIDTLARFKQELDKQGLDLNYIRMQRDNASNADVGGEPNSDHLIGLAADANVTAKSGALSPLEIQKRILIAAKNAGVQQMNMYG